MSLEGCDRGASEERPVVSGTWQPALLRAVQRLMNPEQRPEVALSSPR
jgi:hypothetical protein